METNPCSKATQFFPIIISFSAQAIQTLAQLLLYSTGNKNSCFFLDTLWPFKTGRLVSTTSRGVSSLKGWEGISSTVTHYLCYKRVGIVYLVPSCHTDSSLHHCACRLWGQSLRTPRPWAEGAKGSSDEPKMYRRTPQTHWRLSGWTQSSYYWPVN